MFLVYESFYGTRAVTIQVYQVNKNTLINWHPSTERSFKERKTRVRFYTLWLGVMLPNDLIVAVMQKSATFMF